jgi:antitoxin component of MazEF toxin-antitoxin module
MNTRELQVKESIDGELYFQLPDDLLNRLSWKEGDEIKFVKQDEGFLLKKVRCESVDMQLKQD